MNELFSSASQLDIFLLPCIIHKDSAGRSETPADRILVLQGATQGENKTVVGSTADFNAAAGYTGNGNNAEPDRIAR
jgi:hypothetical protein